MLGKTLTYLLLAGLGLALPVAIVHSGLKDISTVDQGVSMASLPVAADITVNSLDDASLFKTYLGRAPADHEGLAAGPRPFLPPATDGWVRVTALDVLKGDVLDRLRTGWPRTQDGLSRPLEENAGYQQLSLFVRHHSKPTVEQRLLARRMARAIYLHPNGEYMVVRMDFIEEGRALGPENDPEAWLKSLALHERRKLKPSEILEHTQLGQFPVLNRTRPAGSGGQFRPIAHNMNRPVALRVTSATSSRSFVQISGIVQPAAIDTFLSAIDRPALAALLD